MDKYKQMAAEIILSFEHLLDQHCIIIPDEDRTGSTTEAPIYGTTYANLRDEIVEVLRYYMEVDL